MSLPTITFAGVTRAMLLGWNIEETTNGRNMLSCEIPSSDQSYRPSIDDEIIVKDSSGVTIFGGNLQTPTEHGLSDGHTPISTTVDAIDFNALVDRRYVTEDIPIGSLKAALQVLVLYLTPYGVSLDGSQVVGPTLPELKYVTQKMADVLTNVSQLSGGYLWEIDYTKVFRMFLPGSISAPFNIADTDNPSHLYGDVSVSKTRAGAGQVYANRIIVQAGTPDVPIVATADDAGEQAAHGLWELAIAAPTIFDLPTATALAAAYLASSTPTPKTVIYNTQTPGIHPGQTQSIVISKRNVNNTFLVTNVEVRPFENKPLFKVTAIEGSIYQPGWQQMYQTWVGSSLASVAIVPATAGAGRTAYFLGGSAIESVQSSTPTWTPVDGTAAAPGMQVQLDTTARGSTLAKVTVRVRAASGTVAVRLQNISDNVTVGSASAVSGAAFQTVVFTANLTPGSKVYQLELLPSLANVDVAGIGYVE